MQSGKRRAKAVLSGAALATAAAGIFLSGAIAAAAPAAAPVKVRCFGVNACQGKSQCKTAAAQKGENACQGKGLLFLTEEQCRERGGRLEEAEEPERS